jgi:hypothetical protein
MPQSTNLNKNPYYDDFNDSKNFYKVLFKPGVTVQARELTTLQSILQNQIEKLGSAFFKKNTVVVPGGFAYDSSIDAVEVESTYKGSNVEDYFGSFVGLILKGNTSNISAKVESVLSKNDSVRGSTTFYVKYQNSSSTDFNTSKFEDGEELSLTSDVNISGTPFLNGTSVAKLISPIDRKATSVASAAKIEDGIYFIRGYFVNVAKNSILLDQYSNTPSCRVGLLIEENIIDSTKDSSLNDNAQGFSNYAAPGADRFKISLTLISKDLTDFNDDSFIELFRVENGILIEIANQTDSSYIADILARRTFDESGNYYVNEFNVELLESLNNYLNNKGLYYPGQSGIGTSSPSEDIGVLKVSPGKAYVKGYEVPTNTSLLSFPKPRSTAHVESSSSSFYAGKLLRVNNTKSVLNIGLTTDVTIPLYNQRLSNGSTNGTQIGVARAYDFSSYLTSNQNSSSQSDLRLFDIQMYGSILTDSVLDPVVVGDYIKGSNSGATAYITNLLSSTINVYQVSGNFIPSETLIVNGINSTVSIGTFINYSTSDIKSISVNNVFTADTLLNVESTLTGPFTLISDESTATIRSNNGSSFTSNLKVNDIIKYTQVGFSSYVFAGITSIDTLQNQINISGVSTVSNVCTGNLGISTTLQSISVIRPQIIENNSSFYSELNNKNIANINFLNSNVYVKVSNTVIKSSTTLNLPDLSGTDYVYATYDASRYVVSNADGSLENLDNATFTITNGGKTAVFTNLSSTSGPCKVISTQIKSNVTQKFKKLQRSSFVTVANTKYNPSTKVGLAYTSIYGTRVEDDEISLNIGDIVEVHGVFESSTSSNPTLPNLSFTGLNSPNSKTSDLIVGELVVGSTSGAVAVYAKSKTNTQIYFIYKNNNTFILGETISFKESGYTADVSTVSAGDKNILDRFTLDNGQRKHYYDFGRIVRENSSREPSGRLTIVFDYFDFDSTDYGDIISTNSYPLNLYGTKIPSYDGIRNTDIIDIRPKVTAYDPNVALVSPFDFISRYFYTGQNNPTQIIASNENFIFDYDFYLPRTDKLTLSKDGIFNLVLGDPSQTPVSPSLSSEVLDVATIISSPYVYDVTTDVKITLTDNRRYTMSDLRTIENRVSNLEYYTSLSLLETNTQNLLIEDENGFNRFKTGFFVDNFSGDSLSDLGNVTYKALISNNQLSATKNEDRIDLSLFYTNNITPISEININDTTSTNIKRTGSTLSLNYSEVTQFSQPFASKVTNVNPFNIITWQGFVELSPSRDVWTTSISKRVNIADPSRKGTTVVKKVTTDIPYIRTRNINFAAVRLKPNTRFKLLFDSRTLSKTENSTQSLAFPKLLEISNVTGTFQVGEVADIKDSSGRVICSFKVCQPNHKSGPIDAPTLIFEQNPYNPSIGISSQYGNQSTILNVDTLSLSRGDISGYWGNIQQGNNITGRTSKSVATVSDVRLITNEEGVLIGSVWIAEENQFRTGNTNLELNVYSSTPKVPGETADSSASAVFTSNGTNTTTTTFAYYDPIAQTFDVSEDNGIIPTSVDVYFYSKDSTLPVTLEIREVSFGTPGGPDKVIPGLRKTLSSSQVNTSSDASVATTFTFDNLVKLNGNAEYALVLTADTDGYQVWISSIGDEDISTRNSSNLNKIFINKQPSLGTLFKSQNGTTWVPSPIEDLKFNLKKANFTQSSGTVRFYNSVVETRSIENKLPNNPITAISSTSSDLSGGRHILVFHPNHGMYSPNNKVEITGVMTDSLPSTLTVAYESTASGPISVASTSIFTTFEGSNVSALNPGYIQIGNEIIKFEGYGVNQLINITRGMYGTQPGYHSIGNFVYKYEYNNVSLARINAQHTIAANPIPTLDTYYVQVSAGSSFTSTKSGGGSDVYASRNKVFGEIQLNDGLVTQFNNTQVSSSIRSVTATSVNNSNGGRGSEISFSDLGYQSIGITSETKFDVPRMVASSINESQYLNSTQFIGNKSFTLELNLETTDSNVSPLIDLTQNFATTKIYNINQPVGISSYSTDNRVNSNIEDPNNFVYISNRVDLNQSSTSLKVLLSAYRNSSSDIRVLYKIFTNSVPDSQQIWQLFPGYDNLDANSNVVKPANNNGKPDYNVRSSLNNEYLDYAFTSDNLSPFTGFAIKIIGTSTNQTISPLIKDLRAIALQ